MEMCYNSELVMPKNFAVVNEEEMTYVDGGLSFKSKWYGWQVVLSDHECDVVANASNYAAAVTGLLVCTGLEIPAAVSAGLWVVSAEIGLMNSFRHKGVTVNIQTLIGAGIIVLPR